MSGYSQPPQKSAAWPCAFSFSYVCSNDKEVHGQAEHEDCSESVQVSTDQLILLSVAGDGQTIAYLEVLVDDCDGEQDAGARANCTLPQ